MKFVGLHAHDGNSVGDGFNFPEDHYKFVVENAESDSMALATTNHGNINSLGYMFQARESLKKKGINFRTIVGNEMYIHPDFDLWKIEKEKASEDKKNKKDDEDDVVVENESESKDKKWYNPVNRRHHLVVLAQNQEGLKNLFKLTSESYKEGNFYRYPRVDFKLFEKYNKGLIVSSACVAGLPSFLILREHEKGDDAVFKALDAEFKPLYDIFGKERAFLELQFNSLPQQQIVNRYLTEYSKRTGYQLIVTADSHYARPEFWKDREIYRLLAQQTKGYNVSKDDIPKQIEDLKVELYPKNGEQLYEAYKLYSPELDPKIVKEAIERTHEIAFQLIDQVEPDRSDKLPKRIYENQKTPEDKFTELCKLALKEKGFDGNQVYIERLNKELDVICKKKFASYFLLLKEAIEQLEKEILIGPGRGSAASSLCCFLLDITKIDPVRCGLIFERFLSEYRMENPDIDSDLEDREIGLRILKNHFGEESVVSITNFNGLQLKSLIKDLSKLYDIPFQEVNEVTSKMEDEAKKLILEEINWDQKFYVFDFDNAYKFSPTFKAFIDKYPALAENVKALFKHVKSLGKHAGGVCIVENADFNMPVIKIRGEYQTPWSEGLTAKHLEYFNIIKYDFLGLSTLKMIRSAIENILVSKNIDPTFENVKKFYNENLHPEVVKEGEEKVIKDIYGNGKFLSVFQFAEKGVQEFTKTVIPSTVLDISDITSLRRPGPMASNSDKKYAEAATDPSSIKYDHPVLESILKKSKGQLCISEDQNICLSDGTFKSIKDIKINDKIITGTGKIGNVIDVINNGKKPVTKYITNYEHNSLECTKDHKIETIFGFKEIQKSSHLLRYRYQQIDSNLEIESPYLLGLFVADGCGNKTNAVITCGTQEIAEIVSKKMVDEFGGSRYVYHKTRAWYAGAKIDKKIQKTSNVLSWLRKYSLWNKTKEHKKTPIEMLSASIENISKYLAGYIDGDGHVDFNIVSISCTYKSNRLIISKLLDILKISHYYSGHIIVIQDHDLFNKYIKPHLIIKKSIEVMSGFSGEIYLDKSEFQSFVDKSRKNVKIKPFLRGVGVSTASYWTNRVGVRINTLLSILSASDRDVFIEKYLRGKFSIQSILTSLDIEEYKEVFDLSIDHEDHSFLAENYSVHNCYQEQFMFIANQLAGFSLLEADDLRKLLMKPVTSMSGEMKQKRLDAGKKFIDGCIANNLSKEKAEYLWNERILPFISYGFVFSHSISYSYNSYACAWLFHYYPVQWACAVLESEAAEGAKPEEKAKAISLVKSFGFDIIFPDINKSEENWKIIDDKTIAAPFTLIKGLGLKAVPEIIKGKPYSKIEDLLFNDNIVYRLCNKKVIDVLARSGALNDLRDSRFDNDKHFNHCVGEMRSEKETKTAAKFDDYVAKTKGMFLPVSKDEMLLNKQSLLGYYDVDSIVTSQKKKIFEKHGYLPISTFPEYQINEVWFILVDWEYKISKKGNPYYLLSVIDDSYKTNQIYAYDIKNSDWLVKNSCYYGKITKYNEAFGFSLYNAEKVMNRMQ